MIPNTADFEKQPFFKRVTSPVLIVFICWALSTMIYNNAWGFLDPRIYRPLAVVCVVLMGASIILGTALVYPIARSRGASLHERVIAGFITPFCWILKELYIMPTSYSIAEKFYYVFNPLFLGLLSLTVIQMGGCEIVCRMAARRKSDQSTGRVFSVGPIITIVAGVGAIYVFNIWGNRLGFWYVHQAIYQYLFVK